MALCFDSPLGGQDHKVCGARQLQGQPMHSLLLLVRLGVHAWWGAVGVWVTLTAHSTTR